MGGSCSVKAGLIGYGFVIRPVCNIGYGYICNDVQTVFGFFYIGTQDGNGQCGRRACGC